MKKIPDEKHLRLLRNLRDKKTPMKKIPMKKQKNFAFSK